MTGLLQYQPLDDRGNEILDELEARLDVKSDRWAGDGSREFYIAAPGEVDLDPNLSAIDSNWEEHIARLTEHTQQTDKGLEIPVPTKGDFDAAMRKVAPPARRKRPDEKDRPQKQSG
jgi:hypothetical protein